MSRYGSDSKNVPAGAGDGGKRKSKGKGEDDADEDEYVLLLNKLNRQLHATKRRADLYRAKADDAERDHKELDAQCEPIRKCLKDMRRAGVKPEELEFYRQAALQSAREVALKFDSKEEVAALAKRFADAEDKFRKLIQKWEKNESATSEPPTKHFVISNATATATATCAQCKKWIDHWLKWSDDAGVLCCIEGCLRAGMHGAHVYLRDDTIKDKNKEGKVVGPAQWIAPMCARHNLMKENLKDAVVKTDTALVRAMPCSDLEAANGNTVVVKRPTHNTSVSQSR